MKQIKNHKKTKRGKYYFAYLSTIEHRTEYQKLVGVHEKSIERILGFLTKGIAIFHIERKHWFSKKQFIVDYHYTINKGKDSQNIEHIKRIHYEAFNPFFFYHFMTKGIIYELTEDEVLNHLVLENL